MLPDTHTLKEIERTENQLRLSVELRAELVASRAAFASRNLDAIYRHIGAQSLICMQLQQGGEGKRAGQIPPGIAPREARRDPRAQKLLLELAAVQRDIRHLNCEQLVWINGTLRTLRMLANAWAGFSPTYARPGAHSNDPAPQARALEAKS